MSVGERAREWACYASVAIVGLATGCGGRASATYVPIAGNAPAMLPRSIEDVEVFLSTPPARPFQEVGIVEVQGASNRTTGTARLVYELRRIAAQSGCEGILLTGSNDSVTGDRWSVETRKGYRASCIVFKDVKSFDPPRGGGGFAFDADVASSAAACARASLKWGAGEAGQLTCSGVLADVGLNATSALRFCEDRLCAIDLNAQPKANNAPQWRDEFRGVRKALEQKYGRPVSADGAEPPDCAADLERCTTPGRTSYTVHWKWASGEGIDLELAVAQSLISDAMHRSAEIHIVYVKDKPRAEPAPQPPPRHEGL